MTKFALVATSALGIVLAVPASAAPVLDQSSTPTGTTRIDNTQTSILNSPLTAVGQVVTVGITGTLSRIAFGMTGSGPATITFYEGKNSYQGFFGQLYSQAISLPGFVPGPGDMNWADLPSWDVSAGGLAVTAGQQLYFTISSAQDGNGVWNYYNGKSFSYGQGESTMRIGTGASAFWANFGTIHSFQTFVDVPSEAPVPEPATWGLMLAGFGMVGAGLRARRRAMVRYA